MGYAVAVNYSRSEKEAQETLVLVRQHDVPALLVRCNVGDDKGVREMVARCVRELGGLDVLVNNAGIATGGRIDVVTLEEWQGVIDINLLGVVRGCRAFVPMMKAQKGGHIVNTASIAGKGGQGWLAVYSATKAGVIGLSQATQMEVGSAGIQVTALCPAFVDTPMTEWVQGQVKPEEMIQPQDLAETVRLLLRTSRYCLIPEIVFTRPGDPSAFAT